MQEKQPSEFYFVHVDSKRDNAKVTKFTRKCQERYDKASLKMRKKIVKAAKKFVRKNASFYIDDRISEEIEFVCFSNEYPTPQIFNGWYCNPRRIIRIIENGSISFLEDELPKNKEDITDWYSLQRYLDALKPKEFYILDNNKKKYTYKQFKKTMGELLETSKK